MLIALLNRFMFTCRYDAQKHAIVVDLEGYNFLLHPATVRRNDTSAASINEWTGERLSRSDDIAEDMKPDTIAPLGNYAVQILWQDGFNQVQFPATLVSAKTLRCLWPQILVIHWLNQL